jgi:hypothetical protein
MQPMDYVIPQTRVIEVQHRSSADVPNLSQLAQTTEENLDARDEFSGACCFQANRLPSVIRFHLPPAARLFMVPMRRLFEKRIPRRIVLLRGNLPSQMSLQLAHAPAFQ